MIIHTRARKGNTFQSVAAYAAERAIKLNFHFIYSALRSPITPKLKGQRPSAVAVVDHLPGHAAVNTDVFAGNEPGLIRAEKQRHMGDIHGVFHPSCRMLKGIGAGILGIAVVNPTWGNRVYHHPPRQEKPP